MGNESGLIFMLSEQKQPQFGFSYWFSPPA
jgi:hypothetical protein